MLFLNMSIIVISPALKTEPKKLLWQLCHWSSHIWLAPYFTGIGVIFYCVSSLQNIKWLLLTFHILSVLLTMVMLLMHLLQCSYRYMHLVPTLAAHQMVVKTMQHLLLWLHVSRKFSAPLYLLMVPMKHGLISTSDGETMLLPKRSVVKIVLFSSWNAVIKIYGNN